MLASTIRRPKELVGIMLRCSPGSTRVELLKGRDFGRDGALDSWDLSECGLKALPEEFCMMLDGNQLKSLPESFGNVTVGRFLNLQYNELQSLPESFGNIAVGGNVLLRGNELQSPPESFGNITVGENLHLEDNPLQSCPGSFRNVKGSVHK
eukprot:TRINITY_DN1084_c0_g1_i7.p1 TRINITY_DN1084_c0_g1~~TRINITY_DN1084_c0_g1_i7.p1  ORF type:complete len:152 (-),score=29.07 TRINITY_DN1084_c0_g1_i7:274-729(-)